MTHGLSYWWNTSSYSSDRVAAPAPQPKPGRWNCADHSKLARQLDWLSWCKFHLQKCISKKMWRVPEKRPVRTTKCPLRIEPFFSRCHSTSCRNKVKTDKGAGLHQSSPSEKRIFAGATKTVGICLLHCVIHAYLRYPFSCLNQKIGDYG